MIFPLVPPTLDVTEHSHNCPSLLLPSEPSLSLSTSTGLGERCSSFLSAGECSCSCRQKDTSRHFGRLHKMRLVILFVSCRLCLYRSVTGFLLLPPPPVLSPAPGSYCVASVAAPVTRDADARMGHAEPCNNVVWQLSFQALSIRVCADVPLSPFLL